MQPCTHQDEDALLTCNDDAVLCRVCISGGRRRNRSKQLLHASQLLQHQEVRLQHQGNWVQHQAQAASQHITQSLWRMEQGDL
jgi:late competence protein required for DNA uptake (superfamily II DNA/RNA helicase)